MFAQDGHLPDNAHASVRMRKDQKPYSCSATTSSFPAAMSGPELPFVYTRDYTSSCTFPLQS